MHPFGTACASSNTSMIANTVVNIWKPEGIFPVPKYKDDLKDFCIPSPTGIFHDRDFSYDYDHTEMLCCITPLDVPWPDEIHHHLHQISLGHSAKTRQSS